VYTAPAMTAVAVARTAANLSAKPSHCVHHVSCCAKGESGGTVYPAKASCDSQGVRRGGARGAGGCRVAPSKAAHQAESVPTQVHFFWEPCNTNASSRDYTNRNLFWKPYKAMVLAETVHIEALIWKPCKTVLQAEAMHAEAYFWKPALRTVAGVFQR